jgi:hypothetical protein
MPPVVFPTNVPLRMPIERKLSMPVRVIEFLDGTEQRWAAGDPLNAFTITFGDVPASEFAAVQNWFDTVKGAFDTTWSFTDADGTVYPDMACEADELAGVENAKATKFSFSVKMRQVVSSGSYAGTPSATYPALYAGVYTQRPFTQGGKWLTTRNDLPSGPRYAWSEWAAKKRYWVCDYPCLTLAELQGRLAFFMSRRGRLVSFTFHDPQANADVPNCRFDTDDFTARNLGAGQWAVTLPICEVFV